MNVTDDGAPGRAWSSNAWGDYMYTRYRALLSVLVCALFAVPSAQALVIKASNYAIGTNLTNDFPGITLENAFNIPFSSEMPGQIYTSPLLVGTDADLDLPQPLLKTLGLNTLNDGLNQFQNIDWRAFEVVFHQSFQSITLELYGYAGLVDANVYSANGDFLFQETPQSGYCALVLDDVCTAAYETITIDNSSTNPIGFILAGAGPGSSYVTAIDIKGLVAEPSTLALLACGLLAIGITLLYRRSAR